MIRQSGKFVQMFCRKIGHGGMVPQGWRLAWYEPRRRVGVYCPPPFDWLFRILREGMYRVHLAVVAPSIERAEVFAMQREHRRREDLAEEYARGYLRGWNECFETCLGIVEEEISSASVWDAGALLVGPPEEPVPPN